MSLILDALNRADQERNEQNQNLSLHSAPTAAPSSKQPVKRWLVEAAIVVIAIVAIYFFAQRDTNGSSSNEKELPEQQDVREKTVLPTPVAVSASTVASPAADRDLKEKNTQEKPVAKPTETIQSSGKKSPSTTKTNSAIGSLYQQQAQAAKEPKKPATSPDKKTHLAKASNSTPSPVSNEADLSLSIFEKMPLLTQMPPRFQQKVPGIDYSVHVYSDTEGSGFVTLNGKRRKVGDNIVPGLVVIKILRNSVVLDYNGTQFRLLSLSSWVNFN